MAGLESGVRSVSAGGDHTCAVKTDNSAFCWGDDAFGQLGNDNVNADSNIPVGLAAPVEHQPNVASIDVGFESTRAP